MQAVQVELLDVVQVTVAQFPTAVQALQTVFAVVVQAVEAYCPEAQLEQAAHEGALLDVE